MEVQDKITKLQEMARKLTEDQLKTIYTKVDEYAAKNVANEVLKANGIRPDLDFTYLGNGHDMYWFKSVMSEDLQKIVDAFPVDSKIQPYSEDPRTLYFSMKLNNPVRENQYSRHSMYIDWLSNGKKIRCELFIRDHREKLEPFLSISDRQPTSSEYHYFTGMSMKQILNVRAKMYLFIRGNKRFYGGSFYLYDEMLSDEIMQALFP